MSSLALYYSSNYSRCPPQSSFTASPEFLLLGSRIQAFVLIPVCIFGIWCILCKTPKYMTAFKWHLLHLHVWFLILTTFYTLLTTPYHFFPAQVRCSLGFFRDLNMFPTHQLYLIQSVYGGIITAVILLFENRHSHLVPYSESFYRLGPKKRAFLAALNFLLGGSNVFNYFLSDTSLEHQEDLKLEYLKVVPCPNELFFSECAFAFDRPKGLVAVYVLLASIVVFSQLIFFIFHSFVYLRRSRVMDAFSERTKKIQRAFFHAALAQIAAPLSVLIVPLILLAYVLLTKKYLQDLINICILMIPTHSLFSTASLFVFIVPYRQFLAKCFKVSKVQEDLKGRSQVAAVSNNVTI